LALQLKVKSLTILIAGVNFLKKETTTIKQKIIIPASPKQVYEAYTDPKKHAAFTGSKATGKPVMGGKYTAWDGYIFGKFLELEADKRVVQEWTTTDWAEGYPASKLELIFKAVPEGTELTMIHSNIPKEQVDEFAEGWTEWYWNPLKEYFSKKSKT
jgi:activator of HSP90 ATPase